MSEQATIEATPEQSTKRRKGTTKAASKEINAKIKKLRDENGLTIAEIGTIVDLDPSNVFRRIQKILPEKQALEQFKARESEVSHVLKAKYAIIQDSAADELMKDFRDGRFAQLDLNKKAEFIKCIAVSSGIVQDKQLDRDGRVSSGNNVFNIVIQAAADAKVVIQAPESGTI